MLMRMLVHLSFILSKKIFKSAQDLENLQNSLQNYFQTLLPTITPTIIGMQYEVESIKDRRIVKGKNSISFIGQDMDLKMIHGNLFRI